MQLQTFKPTANGQNVTIDEKVEAILSGFSFGTEDEAMKKYIKTKLSEQIIQRSLLEMLKDIPSDKFSAFLEFIEKEASQNSLYVYLTAIYPNAEQIIYQKANEVVQEFVAG
jgi:hypothetical protein